ncbi:hypothetical protein RD110_02155 [Rhodoferax koreense]|uniref:DUF2145 domain-containing protein n=1 Tax=Rhodoferax koreensis TaxID=1842727 RepID=A0A1P8K340_9BURK|nr:DUF2145 domain-containing protein [Rhodoferax koreense]APW40416.1 hypothetical protein RD110_02155 [Rhodoferax koreense]
MKPIAYLTKLIAFLLASLWLPAHAGRACEAHAATPQSIERGMALAAKVSQALDASGARVVLLARAGQDLTKYQLRYSHMAFAIKTDAGPWRVVHKLNECGSATSHLYRQGLGEFFLDDPWRFEAAWAVPAPAVQAALWPVLQDRTRLGAMHQPAYSMVAYAWGQKYQQSNQWAVETLALAVAPTGVRNRTQAQAWLQFNGYEPTTLRLGPLTRLGARVGSANIAFDDHPNEKRFADRIETVTADSVLDWLPRAGLGSAAVQIGL